MVLKRDGLCPCCHAVPESVDHCFRSCARATEVWKSLAIMRDETGGMMDFKAWVQHICKHCPTIFGAGLWWIWRDRNNFVFGSDDPWPSNKIIALAKHAAHEYTSSLNM
ncbi:hypothetical protein PIB30_090684, partial [Stylosanthes scabra]|nr:hypothetical protein [Stylosanthes scabra]